MENQEIDVVKKIYRAYSMTQALAAVQADLGGKAVITTTRSYRRGGFMGIGGRQVVEVTAQLPKTPAASKERPKPTPSPKPPAAKTATVSQSMAGRAYSASREPGKARERLSIAMTPNTMPVPESLATPPQRGAEAPVIGLQQKSSSQVVQAVACRQQSRLPGSPQRFMLQPQQELSGVTSKAAGDANSVEDSVDDAADRVSHSMQQELESIKSMVSTVLDRQENIHAAPTKLPEELFEHYLHLVSQDLSDQLAEEVLMTVAGELSGDEIGQEEVVRASIQEHLAALIPVGEDVRLQVGRPGEPRVIVLVGPTGVGKTTTVAKLAAACKLHGRHSVGLITADTYRIAAVDQLRTYANIIGLPLEVALTPADMKQAIHALRGCELILVDTAGRSQNDKDKLAELREMITAADPDEVHLVLSGTAGQRVLMREAEAFSPVGIDRIVLTKLDEAVSFGMLVNVIRQVGATLSFMTTGQEVPDHIEPGSASRLAELVMEGSLVNA